MKRNMGNTDRVARLLMAALLVYAAFGPLMGSGVPHILALGVAAIFTLTSLVGNCPLYSIVGFKTCKD